MQGLRAAGAFDSCVSRNPRKPGGDMTRTKTNQTAPEINLLLRIIDESYEKKAWHGPNLRGSIRGIEVKEAAWRPGPGRHNIWEIVVHATYWKYAVRRRLLGEKRGSFPLKGSNWFTRPAPGADWKKDLRLLDGMHITMRRAAASLRDSEMGKKTKGGSQINAHIVIGIGAHDVYHAGQIQLIKRLLGRPGRR